MIRETKKACSLEKSHNKCLIVQNSTQKNNRNPLKSFVSDSRDCLTTFSNNEKRVEDTSRRRVFSTYLEKFLNVVRHFLTYFDISSQSKLKLRKKRRKKIKVCNSRSDIQASSRI